MSDNERQILKRESRDDRKVRVDRMRANQRESLRMSVRPDWKRPAQIKTQRLAREYQDEREDRLRVISMRRSERLAMESQAEQEDRLQSDRDRRRTLL